MLSSETTVHCDAACVAHPSLIREMDIGDSVVRETGTEERDLVTSLARVPDKH